MYSHLKVKISDSLCPVNRSNFVAVMELGSSVLVISAFLNTSRSFSISATDNKLCS
jgi:hypothetical protein